jgi:hypothetical protein
MLARSSGQRIALSVHNLRVHRAHQHTSELAAWYSSGLRTSSNSPTFFPTRSWSRRSRIAARCLSTLLSQASSPHALMPSHVPTKERLASLRRAMREHDPPIDALIIPSEDAHSSEYIAACDERRAWISGFDGSAGT